MYLRTEAYFDHICQCMCSTSVFQASSMSASDEFLFLLVYYCYNREMAIQQYIKSKHAISRLQLRVLESPRINAIFS
jgi:hypothetical protein